LALGLLVLLGTATVGVGLNLRAVTEDKPETRAAQRSAITILVTLPVVLSALLLSQWLHDTPELFTAPPLHLHLLSAAPWFLVLFMLIQVVSDFPRGYNRTHANSRWRVPGLWAAMLLIPAASAVAAASLVLGLAHVFKLWNEWMSGPFLSIMVGPPLVVLLFSAAVTLQIGLMGSELADAAPEWLTRLGASLLLYSAIWIAFFGASIFGPFLLAALGAWSTWGHVPAGAAWLGTTLTGVLKGKSAATGDPSLEGDAKPPGVMELVTRAAPYVFI